MARVGAAGGRGPGALGGGTAGGVAVVIPVGPGDEAWRELVAALADALPPGTDVVLAGAEAAPRGVPAGARWLAAPRGRARQLNAGARAARGGWLWFLHADSRLDPSTAPALARALGAAGAGAERDALYYFDLAFLGDGPRLMRLNAAGAWLRSRVGGMPFGDQGFCVRRDTWARLGGFDEGAAYGEDHLFVWRARQAGVPVRPAGARLWTSARRYRDDGWLRTTARHVRLTARQAWPEWLRLVRGERTGE